MSAEAKGEQRRGAQVTPLRPAVSLSVRWTMGDVSERGFEALRLSVWGAWRIFGPDAFYTVCVNSMAPEEAARRTGELPEGVRWRPVGAGDIPGFIRRRLDTAMADGVAWKLAPLRLHPDRHELALDNDCILWRMPEAVRRWLQADGATSVVAEDVRSAFGQFDCEIAEPRNGGIRGLPPGFDYESALEETLRRHPVRLSSELDEQGLQVATLARATECLAVPTTDVSICSPFHPGVRELGRCGAHFVGINVRHIPWDYYGRPADECIDEHWRRCRPSLYGLVGLPGPGESEEGTIAQARGAGG